MIVAAAKRTAVSIFSLTFRQMEILHSGACIGVSQMRRPIPCSGDLEQCLGIYAAFLLMVVQNIESELD